ncbi:hypothetical protein PZN02_002081 [Sinorhizobium garamanticum]|uniref:Uncharacterized protein n=1 Tax=Sinorhizobium garamanticum TaxID=680247 RepID=A0ABY8D4R3_9HYPH|nr:hypothetical protein [Sinorhizobium garamanticum]WEX85845.1 hypothetical protein PZN02_002081 [Sinorhizobium garamanticum]
MTDYSNSSRVGQYADGYRNGLMAARRHHSMVYIGISTADDSIGRNGFSHIGQRYDGPRGFGTRNRIFPADITEHDFVYTPGCWPVKNSIA